MVSPETEVTHHAQNLVPLSGPILGLSCCCHGVLGPLLCVSPAPPLPLPPLSPPGMLEALADTSPAGVPCQAVDMMKSLPWPSR